MPKLERLDKGKRGPKLEHYDLSLDNDDTVYVHDIRTKPGLFGLHVCRTTKMTT